MPKVRQIDLSGNYVDLKQSAGIDPFALLSGGALPSKSFFKLKDFVDDLAEDDEFDYVVFDLSRPFIMNDAQLDAD